MKYTVITTFHQEGLELYGQKMINSFEQHWPESVELVVYAENCNPITNKSNVRVIDLLAANKSLRKFLKILKQMAVKGHITKTFGVKRKVLSGKQCVFVTKFLLHSMQLIH
jgi:nucleoside diphosphate kinase